MPDTHVATVLQFLVGWISGMDNAIHLTKEAKQDEMLHRMSIVAYAAGLSSANVDRYHQRKVQ